MSAQSDMAEGLLYYQLVVDGEDVQAKFNPDKLPRTTMAPNVRVKLCQLLIHPSGELLKASSSFYYDGSRLYACESGSEVSSPGHLSQTTEPTN